mmetsp:Transcript_9717/g.32963  ORF Transcript_9717/g.32963 Transcript_9717/m.32963 type:complete len:172 (-) Transcript_9717:607-1122(-)
MSPATASRAPSPRRVSTWCTASRARSWSTPKGARGGGTCFPALPTLRGGGGGGGPPRDTAGGWGSRDGFAGRDGPDAGPPGPGPGPDDAARPRLKLLPRTKPVEQVGAPEKPAAPNKPNPFGNAKPREEPREAPPKREGASPARSAGAQSKDGQHGVAEATEGAAALSVKD